MKNFIISGIILLLASCGQNTELQIPAEQTRFINYVKYIRNAINSSNEANRSIQLNNGVLLTKAYVKDTLSLKFDSWHATLVEIIEKPASIEINLSIPLDPSNKSAQKSIILSGMLQISKNKIIQGLKVAGVEVDRRVLSELATNDPVAFSKLVEIARKNVVTA